MVTRLFEDALRETGLTVTQLILLCVVALKQPLSPISLARALDLDKSTLSRTLRPLLKMKLLISEIATGGGQTLRVTRKGSDEIRRVFPEWKKAQTEVLTLLGTDAVAKLDSMIAALNR